MCIRDRLKRAFARQYGSVDDDAVLKITGAADQPLQLLRRYKNERSPNVCLLYTSDAADERSSVDLGGRRIIKKKKKHNTAGDQPILSPSNHTRLTDTDTN